MSLHGLIIYNGFLKGEQFYNFAFMLKEAAIKKGHTVDIKTNDAIVNCLADTFVSENNLEKTDYVLFTDKDIYLANSFERAKIPVFNRAKAIEISDDKIKTYEHLIDAKIPTPKTIVAPKTFGSELQANHSFVQNLVEQLTFPFIIKEAFGSFGEQVYLVHNEEQLHTYLQKTKGKPFVFQQYIASSYGVDLRLQVVGNEVVAAMKRRSKSDFRANVTAGGTMEPYEPNEYEKKLALAATKAIGADFAGVDLLFGTGEKRYVCEVNSNAHLQNLLDCTGINAAPSIIEHVEQQVSENISQTKTIL